ncbi:hypothetical protein KIF59_06865 [Enterobacter cloacae subsp. cloacae]|nr:hypothetical protein [Enterobacter cloacae subsp. cloacae]
MNAEKERRSPAHEIRGQRHRFKGLPPAPARPDADKASPSSITISSLITRSSAALTSSFGPLRSMNSAVWPLKCQISESHQR